MATRTIGVSIPVPPPYGEYLQGRRASFGDPLAPYIRAHITLLGPTLVDDTDRPELTAHLAYAASQVPPFTVILRGTGSFRPVSDVVFVQVASGISSCEQLERQIRRGPYEREQPFPYHPHVTVAHDVGLDELARAFEELAGFGASFDVDAFQLWEREGDGTWLAVESFPLGESPS
ncbi:MAG TPA: 2'-5' RNA ligase family protein [Candidatus Lustribacter sp.]|nr:2'-5' RNA ligase family protein [Candidatus Lustribacter sp.]